LRDSETVVELGRVHGLALYFTWRTLLLCWARARLSDREAGVTELRHAITAYTDQGNKLYVPFFQGLLAEIEAEGQDVEGALTRIDERLWPD
jgi:hypothetical protein